MCIMSSVWDKKGQSGYNMTACKVSCIVAVYKVVGIACSFLVISYSYVTFYN